MHLKKPQTAIYKTVMKDLNCSSKQIIFIDDKQKYTKKAQKLGINGITYTNKNNLLEFRRKQLFETEPPNSEFNEWMKLPRPKKKLIKPPI